MKAREPDRPAEDVNEAERRPKRGRPRHETPSAEFLARREEIVAAATEVFHTKGFDAGSLRDVAETLELRKATLYYYVGTKAELLYLICGRSLDSALAQLDEISKERNSKKRIELLIKHQAAALAADKPLYTVFFDERPKLDPAFEASVRAKERRYLDAFYEAVETAVRDGALPNVSTRYAAQAILGMTSWVYKWFDPRDDDVEEFTDTCLSLILRQTRTRR